MLRPRLCRCMRGGLCSCLWPRLSLCVGRLSCRVGGLLSQRRCCCWCAGHDGPWGGICSKPLGHWENGARGAGAITQLLPHVQGSLGAPVQNGWPQTGARLAQGDHTGCRSSAFTSVKKIKITALHQHADRALTPDCNQTPLAWCTSVFGLAGLEAAVNRASPLHSHCALTVRSCEPQHPSRSSPAVPQAQASLVTRSGGRT